MKSNGRVTPGTSDLGQARDEARAGLMRRRPEHQLASSSTSSLSLPKSLLWAGGAVALLVLASAASVLARRQAASQDPKLTDATVAQAPRERETIAAVVAPVAEIGERSATPTELASAATPAPVVMLQPGSNPPSPPEPPAAGIAPDSLTRWEYVGPLGVPQRHYTFLATTRSGLFAATFNNSSQDGVGSDVYFLVPRTNSERLVISVPSKPFTGFSGLAVDEAHDAVFVCLDQGSPTDSAVYRFTLGGPPAETFGSGGKLVLNRRPLGCAVASGILYVLVDWGFVLRLNPETGAQQGTPVELQSGLFLRDIAINDGELAAYGNGNFVEFNIPASGVVARKQLLANSTPRATEGIGMNPATGEFIVRPIDTADLLTIRREDALSTPVEPTQLSRHTVDFACAPDGSALFVSDLLRKEIIRYRRSAPRPGTAAPARNTTSTP